MKLVSCNFSQSNTNKDFQMFLPTIFQYYAKTEISENRNITMLSFQTMLS